MSDIATTRTESATPILIDIRNRSEFPLRCVVVLAHFVTQDLEVIAPGTARPLVIERLASDGALAHGSHRDQPMLVENILCGRTDDWTATRTDIPLGDVRAGTDNRFTATCHDSGELRCSVSTGPARPPAERQSYQRTMPASTFSA